MLGNTLTTELQERANTLLKDHFTVPQRYGTAFHLTPPVQDVRELPFSKQKSSFSQLSQDEYVNILSTLSESDPYLLWQLVNLSSVPHQIIRVPEGHTMDLQISSSELLWIFIERNAHLKMEQILLGEKFLMPRAFVWQETESSFEFWGLRSQNEFLTERMEVRLQGRGASTKVRHLTLGSEKQQVDMQVSVYHEEKQTESSLAVRTAATGKHVSVYRGLIDIAGGAQGSVGYQQGRALFLSRQAVVDNLPELAIRTNDVRCSHGVNTTHIDDTSLFYMRSRGLPYSEARRLAIGGFYHDTMEIPQSVASPLSTFIDTL